MLAYFITVGIVSSQFLQYHSLVLALLADICHIECGTDSR